MVATKAASQRRRAPSSSSSSSSSKHRSSSQKPKPPSMAAAAAFYDRHVEATRTETRADRQAKESIYLNRFHNEVKRSILEMWVRPGDDVLDICCGRFGDKDKYMHTGVRSVVGIDVSSASIEIARQRLAESALAQQHQECYAQFFANVRFECVDVARQPDWSAGHEVHVATCFFALQYMCSSRATLSNLMGLASRHLVGGGRFLACFPDGDAVQRLVAAGMQDSQEAAAAAAAAADNEPLKVRTGCLGLRETSLPTGRELGHTCEFSIKGTVTSGGSVEPLAWSDVILAVAAEHNLFPPTAAEKLAFDVQPQDWQDARDDDEPLQHFFPRFPAHVDRSWAAASRLNVALVLVKRFAAAAAID